MRPEPRRFIASDNFPSIRGNENLLLCRLRPGEVPNNPYGKACTDNTDAVFEGDVVTYVSSSWSASRTVTLGEVYPWDGSRCILRGDATHRQRRNTDQDPSRNGASKSSLPILQTSTESSRTEWRSASRTPCRAPARAGAWRSAGILATRFCCAPRLVLGSISKRCPRSGQCHESDVDLLDYDLPGGASSTLVEGSTISTSMAIDGAHAAQLEDSWQIGTSVGAGVGFKTIVGGPGLAVEQNVVTFGGSAGFSYAHTPTDVTVSRSSSRHFDIGISFSVGISTSDSPYIAGQPSDVIIGGGANLRFISAIEIYAKADSVNGGLCLGGLTALEFLPEQISTWVMSVYEIEKTIERIGAALTDPNTKIEAKPGVPDPRDDLVKQIENWRTVLTNYRAATMKDQALSVAEQLKVELNTIHENFQSFLEAATTGGFEADQFSDFLSHGLNELEKHKLIYHREQKNLGPVGDTALSDAETMEDVADRPRLELYENDVLDELILYMTASLALNSRSREEKLDCAASTRRSMRSSSSSLHYSAFATSRTD